MMLQPFWPTGSGCARGFLGSLDAAWMMKGWGEGKKPLNLLAEREGIFRLLAQTTPENLCKNFSNYSIKPDTRYIFQLFLFLWEQENNNCECNKYSRL